MHKTPACQAAGPDYLTDNPVNMFKVSTTALSWKFSCPWWQQVTHSQMFSGLDLQDYGCKSCKIIWTSFLSSCLMQLVSNPKVNPQNHCLKLFSLPATRVTMSVKQLRVASGYWKE